MFPDQGDKLDNTFFNTWKSRSIFHNYLSPPPFLLQEFSDEWINNLKLKLGDGPLTPFMLDNLSNTLQKLQGLQGYNEIIKRIEKLDDTFFPTLSEIILIEYMIEKIDVDKVLLEYSFSSSSGKNPELKINKGDVPFVFEVTCITNYRDMENIINYYNMFVAFIHALDILYKKKRKLIIDFYQYPNTSMTEYVYKAINFYFEKIITNVNVTLEAKDSPFKITFSEGFDVVFNIHDYVIENKIKDKIDEKATKFSNEDASINCIVIDISLLTQDIKTIEEYVTNYFDYSDIDYVNSIMLLKRTWNIIELEPEYVVNILEVFNPNSKKKTSILDELYGLHP